MPRVKEVSSENLAVKNSVELLSYIINQDPVLYDNIDLPVQGESIKPIGKIIMSNPVYKNAFLNTVNLIGLTVITRNHWENPWKKFTDKGRISYGQQVREIIVDIANVYDYNEMLKNECDFVKTEVPNVLSYLHEVNYQKFYKTTTSDEQMAMAFETENLFTLIDQIVNSLYEGMEYDSYQANKYMLARRILSGTVTTYYIEDFKTKTDRDIVSEIKGVSSDMTFRSPDFNPAGVKKATSYDDQFVIVSTKFDARFKTNVLATSYFRDDADMKARLELCDGFGKFDEQRLNMLFAKRDDNGDVIEGKYVAGYEPITEAEKTALNKIVAVIVGYDFFQDYYYGMDNMSPNKKTDFYNPQTLKRNHFLHQWGTLTTSPFENACVFTIEAPTVTGVTVTPKTSTVSASVGKVQLYAEVETTGFANQAVMWTVTKGQDQGVTVNQSGLVTIPKDFTAGADAIQITATSIYDNSKKGTASITVA